MLNGKRILLVIGGGIAAYKALDLIRRLKERGAAVRCILTKAAQEFVTPLAAGALAGERAFTDLFDAQGEFDVGHIRLARETDLVVVAPAKLQTTLSMTIWPTIVWLVPSASFADCDKIQVQCMTWANRMKGKNDFRISDR